MTTFPSVDVCQKCGCAAATETDTCGTGYLICIGCGYTERWSLDDPEHYQTGGYGCFYYSLPGETYLHLGYLRKAGNPFSPEELANFSSAWYSHKTDKGWEGVQVVGEPYPAWPAGLIPYDAEIRERCD
jgi:hypothetical protein